MSALPVIPVSTVMAALSTLLKMSKSELRTMADTLNTRICLTCGSHLSNSVIVEAIMKQHREKLRSPFVTYLPQLPLVLTFSTSFLSMSTLRCALKQD